MTKHITIRFGDRGRMIAMPPSYTDLLKEARKHFPKIGSVYNIVVLYQPKHLKDTLYGQYWIELDRNAYSSINDQEVLYFNVQDPLTKEYILPLPDQDPNILPNSQIRAPDKSQHSTQNDARNFTVNKGDDKVSCEVPHSFVSSYRDLDTLPPYRPGDSDACSSGWGHASERFRQSAKYMPDLKDCKSAEDYTVDESPRYPDEHHANNKGDTSEQAHNIYISKTLLRDGPKYQPQYQPHKDCTSGCTSARTYKGNCNGCKAMNPVVVSTHHTQKDATPSKNITWDVKNTFSGVDAQDMAAHTTFHTAVQSSVAGWGGPQVLGTNHMYTGPSGEVTYPSQNRHGWGTSEPQPQYNVSQNHGGRVLETARRQYVASTTTGPRSYKNGKILKDFLFKIFKL